MIKKFVLLITVLLIGNMSVMAETHARKILVIGDSMTGWLAERINAHAQKNGYVVETVVWDGATIAKYANNSKFAGFIKQHDPDGVVVCLGMNEMLGHDFENRLKPTLDKFVSAIGNRSLLWVGPPSWPGKGTGKEFNDFMVKHLGAQHYIVNTHLNLPRQSKTNPHPTRSGMNIIGDAVIEFNEKHNTINLPGYVKPGAGEASRSKVYIYKKMKEQF